MKLMKELKGLSRADLEKRTLDLKRELLKENVQVLTGVSSKSAGNIRKMRRTIARIHMLLGKEESRNA